MTKVKVGVAHIPRSGRKAPQPTTTERVYPWRFLLGETVYVVPYENGRRGRGDGELMSVDGGELWMGCPHLLLRDAYGATWRVPQLHCSGAPLPREK